MKSAKAVCEHCGREFQYDPRVSKGRFCGKECRYAEHSRIIKESYTPELRAKRSEAAKKQMEDPEQISRRRETSKFKRTKEMLENMSKATKKQMEDPEMRKKIGDAHRKNVDYRQIAIDAHGTKCQRCGRDMSENTSEICVHHIDGDHYIDEITDNSPDNLMVLCHKCHAKIHWELKRQAEKFVGQYHFEQAANHILEGLKQMGFEVDYENFHGTPKRFARAYQEIFEGCIDTEKQVKDILSTSFPAEGNDNMVVAENIICFSMCPHHILPVEYHVCVGYIPNRDGRVLGISKLSRLVSVLAARPMLQETFTKHIVTSLESIGVSGAIALVEGQHMCMRMRGARAVNTTITTTAISGCFEHDPSCKAEFMANIQHRLKFRGA